MNTVTITLTETPPGKVCIDVRFEPPAKGSDDPATHQLAVRALQAIVNSCHGDQDHVVHLN